MIGCCWKLCSVSGCNLVLCLLVSVCLVSVCCLVGMNVMVFCGCNCMWCGLCLVVS